MNRVQVIIFCATVLTLAAMMAYPPWEREVSGTYVSGAVQSAGYHFVTSPPNCSAYYSVPETDCAVRIDFKRLAVASLAVFLLGGAAFFVLGARPKTGEPRRKNITISKKDSFNLIASSALLRLDEEFPDPIDLDASQVADAAIQAVETREEQHAIVAATAPNTIKYLVDEGFINYRDEFHTLGRSSTSIFPQAVLTAKGHRLLNSAPEVVDEDADHRSYHDKLADAVEKGKGGVAALVIRELAGLLAKES